jgi:hypothetical protein
MTEENEGSYLNEIRSLREKVNEMQQDFREIVSVLEQFETSTGIHLEDDESKQKNLMKMIMPMIRDVMLNPEKIAEKFSFFVRLKPIYQKIKSEYGSTGKDRKCIDI